MRINSICAPRIMLTAELAGSLLRSRAYLIQKLVEQGYEVTLAAAPDDSLHLAKEAGCTFHGVNIANRRASILADIAVFIRYIRLITTLRPSVVLSFTVKPNIYAGLAARICRTRFVPTINGAGSAFINKTRRAALARALYRIGLRKADAIVFQNHDDRAMFKQHGLGSQSPTRVVPGCVDINSFFPPKVGPAAGDTFTFLLVGRLLVEKGVNEYLEAARLVKRQRPSARFLLLGPFEHGYGGISPDVLQAAIADGVVEYLGEQADVRPHLASADCVVLPSYREGSPRALLEACAMALPIIGSDVPGVRDIIIDRLNGLLCAARNPSDLASKMLILLDLPRETRKAMGAAGRERIQAHFRQDRVSAEYVALIRQVCEPRLSQADDTQGPVGHTRRSS